jgi:hypothetical protein
MAGRRRSQPSSWGSTPNRDDSRDRRPQAEVTPTKELTTVAIWGLATVPGSPKRLSDWFARKPKCFLQFCRPCREGWAHVVCNVKSRFCSSVRLRWFSIECCSEQYSNFFLKRSILSCCFDSFNKAVKENCYWCRILVLPIFFLLAGQEYDIDNNFLFCQYFFFCQYSFIGHRTCAVVIVISVTVLNRDGSCCTCWG